MSNGKDFNGRPARFIEEDDYTYPGYSYEAKTDHETHRPKHNDISKRCVCVCVCVCVFVCMCVRAHTSILAG